MKKTRFNISKELLIKEIKLQEKILEQKTKKPGIVIKEILSSSLFTSFGFSNSFFKGVNNKLTSVNRILNKCNMIFDSTQHLLKYWKK